MLFFQLMRRRYEAATVLTSDKGFEDDELWGISAREDAPGIVRIRTPDAEG